MEATSRGSTCFQSPDRSLRKSGMPEGVLMPAPVSARVRRDARSNSAARAADEDDDGDFCESRQHRCGKDGSKRWANFSTDYSAAASRSVDMPDAFMYIVFAFLRHPPLARCVVWLRILPVPGARGSSNPSPGSLGP